MSDRIQNSDAPLVTVLAPRLRRSLYRGLPLLQQWRSPVALVLIAVLLTVAACNDSDSGNGSPQEAQEGQPATQATDGPQAQPAIAATATPVPPTATPEEPLAAEVNGQPIHLATFEEALLRQQQGQSAILSDPGTAVDQETQVLNMLIERALIEQAAEANGIAVTPQMVEQQMAELRQVATESGGEGSFEAWIEANQWTEASFRDALAYEMLTERVASAVTAEVPETVPQVRARYIQVEDEALAQSLLEQIGDGADFASLARQHSLDRVTAADGGDLGYFARGTLLVPELEEAAFSLEPGEVSDLITASSADGGETVYYLLQVVDVDPQRPLGPDQRAALLQEHFNAWLADQWSQAEIVRYIETGT